MTNLKTTKRDQARRMIGWGAALLALSSAAAGCADHVQSAVAACPCDQGVCCASGVCAPDENSCTTATAALSALSAGQWTGYVENYMFSSSSDALDLTLQVGSDDTLSGQMILGQGTVPAPPTDGNVRWPSTYDPASGIQPIEGFAYHLMNIRWTALRLRFDIALSEPWDAWCRLLQPVVSQWDATGCIGAVQPYSPTLCGLGNKDELVGVSCDRDALCGENVCACSDSSCVGAMTHPLSFDIALQGDEGDGSILGLSMATDGRNVRLIRASN